MAMSDEEEIVKALSILVLLLDYISLYLPAVYEPSHSPLHE